MKSGKPTQDFPYKTYLNILHDSLELIDVQKLADACKDKWYNQTLCKVNDSVVRMAVVQGEYHWHEHGEIDEFFFVLDGRFLIDLEDRTIALLPRQKSNCAIFEIDQETSIQNKKEFVNLTVFMPVILTLNY